MAGICDIVDGRECHARQERERNGRVVKERVAD